MLSTEDLGKLVKPSVKKDLIENGLHAVWAWQNQVWWLEKKDKKSQILIIIKIS